jgi:hypothetical protein
MSVWAILLRILLSLALVLNGATGAAAAVRMHMSHEDGQALPIASMESPRSPSADMPCHQQAAEADNKAALAADDSAPSGSRHATLDCCKSSSCNCACAHATQTLLAGVFIHAALGHPDPGVGALLPGHPSPALPKLNRPPIG